jgi:C4-dicarboxylate-specific signal transduction histidine kinase
MQGIDSGTAVLLTVEGLILSVFVFSERLRQSADVVCCAFLGLFLHRLLDESGGLANSEWDIISACVFALSFSFIGWSALRKNLSQTDVNIEVTRADASVSATDVAVHDDRLRTLGLMNARLVHEMSHPLSTLTLRFEELRRNRMTGDSEVIDSTLQSIHRQLKHLTQLTESMRTYASDHRNNRGGFVPLEDVFKLAGEFCGILANDLGVQLKWPDVTPEIEVSGGVTLQTQVLVNLLKNAVEAVSAFDEPEQKWVKVELRERGGSVEISVSNGGPRLSKNVQSLLFKPFFSGKKTGQGMGLGLTLCRELAESIGGEIWYDADAKNPTFVVRYAFLPRVSRTSDDTASYFFPFQDKRAS